MTLHSPPSLSSLLRPIDADAPATPQIRDRLRGAILRLSLAPGRSLSEGEIAVALGASRTPVRAALQELRDIGLVETRPSRGTTVTLLDAHRMRAAQFVREAVEVEVVRRLSATPIVNAKAIRANLDAQARAAAARGAEAFHVLDDDFHRLLSMGTGFTYVADVLEREKAQLDRARVLLLRDTTWLAKLQGDHTAVFEAAQAGQTDRAIAETRAHSRLVLDTMAGLARDHSSYFTGETI